VIGRSVAKAHERIGRARWRRKSSAARDPGAGDRMRGRARCDARQSVRQPCKRQSPRQDHAGGLTSAGGVDRRRELKPRSRRHPHPRPIAFADLVTSNRRSVTPTKINRGGGRGTNDTWARTGRNAEATVISARADHLPSRRIHPAGIVHPSAGSNLRRAATS
jgi:hypothetical protein